MCLPFRLRIWRARATSALRQDDRRRQHRQGSHCSLPSLPHRATLDFAHDSIIDGECPCAVFALSFPATTASSRLLLGDAVDDADTGTAAADPTARRPGDEVVTAADGRGPLSKLSVITFNAPKAFTKALAELYMTRMALVQGEHLRFTHKGDAMRSAPLIPGMSHVGQKIKYGDKLVNGKGVLLTGAALALGGPVAAVVGAGAYFGKKMENNHCGH